MFIRRKDFINYQADCIASLQNDIKALKEMVETSKRLIESQEKKIFDLTRENRVLVNKIDVMRERLDGSVISYG